MLDDRPSPDWRAEFKRLEGAYAPATMRAYYSDLEAYTEWCETTARTAFPASVETVAAFLDAQSESKAVSTIRRRLYAIRKAHRLLDFPDPTTDEDVNLSLRRIRRNKLARPRQAKGLNRTLLDRLIAVQPDDPWGLRNKAMLSLGYDILARRSELVALRIEDVTLRPDGSLRVLIRRSKSDQFGLGRVAFSSTRTSDAVQRWLSWRGETKGPLFCPIYKDNAISRHLSSDKVKRLIKESAAKAGFNSTEIAEFSGHSLRVGAAQDLLCAGHDTVTIMRAGGWKSVSVLARYLENAEHNVWG